MLRMLLPSAYACVYAYGCMLAGALMIAMYVVLAYMIIIALRMRSNNIFKNTIL